MQFNMQSNKFSVIEHNLFVDIDLNPDCRMHTGKFPFIGKILEKSNVSEEPPALLV